MSIFLDSPVSDLTGVGTHYENKLYSLGIECVRDLLFHFPFRWDDFSHVVKISAINPEEKVTLQCKLLSVRTSRSFRKRMAVTEAIISDETGNLKAVWYNQPFLQKSLKEGTEYRLSGKVKVSRGGTFLQSPSFEPAERETTQTGGLIPIYHVTEGITPKMLRFLIRKALPCASQVTEYMPESTIKSQSLINIAEALRFIHFPESKPALSKARKRLAFDELFIMQLNYQLRKSAWKQQKAAKIEKNIELIKKSLAVLPFQLTDDQKLALWEIIDDCDSHMPMNRLLEGDVGSGKTVVAALACVNAVSRGYQAALMAPTEILARQHFRELKNLIAKTRISVALLTSSLASISSEKSKGNERKKILDHIRKGNVQIVVGTHSLIQDTVIFKNLAFAVVDEQHRFGVKQRANLIKATGKIHDGLKETVPHLLSMTATPIPRTLALTLYGDLEISIIKKMPGGRKKIVTKVIPPNKRTAVYDFISKQVRAGRQAFIICPLIEESETLEAKAAESEFTRIKDKIFPTMKIGLLHGKMPSAQKEDVMSRFSAREFDILVSTSVVEVGIDVPNATVMVIEGAERFGISQLHQFRGRVGRGKHQSYCFLFTDSPSAKTWKRVTYLEETDDGFALSEKDLELRGPGEFLGQRQSGFSNLVVASLKDVDLIKSARLEAEKLVQKDPALSCCPALKKKMELLDKKVHFE